MSGERDAFGRPVAGSTGTPTPDGGPSAPAPAARPVATPTPTTAFGSSRPSRADRRPAGPGRGSRVLVLLLITVASAAGVTAVMRYAIDWSRTDPAALSAAFTHDPFGPRSLLLPEPARVALDAALTRVRDGERIIGLTFTPERIIITALGTDGRMRWIGTSGGRIAEHRTDTIRPVEGTTAHRVSAADLEAPLAALRSHWQGLRPDSERPTLLMSPDHRGRVSGWSILVEGVRSDRRSRTIDTRGRVTG
ncbi:MAG: hypothetical protein AB7G37_19990 [Solirubrobacteraceae bacterium]